MQQGCFPSSWSTCSPLGPQGPSLLSCFVSSCPPDILATWAHSSPDAGTLHLPLLNSMRFRYVQCKESLSLSQHFCVPTIFPHGLLPSQSHNPLFSGAAVSPPDSLASPAQPRTGPACLLPARHSSTQRHRSAHTLPTSPHLPRQQALLAL